MPLIAYRQQRFNSKAAKTIKQALEIIDDLQAQGYTLTLRQLYYQMVSKNFIANNEREYKRLGRIICDAREVGLIDWYAIEDRGRSCYLPDHTPTPAEVLKNIEMQLRLNPWLDQPVYLVTAVEKAALEGVIERPCARWRAPYMACKGYLSASEAWRTGRRYERALANGKRCVLLHLGDHDPSGLHMTDDNRIRLNLFARGDVEVNRLALNMDQIEQYDPPPNPAKQTDTRYAGYKAEFGEESWELDALSPKVIDGLISDAIESYVDKDKWQATLAEETERRKGLRLLGMRWEEIEKLVLNDELDPIERLKLLDDVVETLPSVLEQFGQRLPLVHSSAAAGMKAKAKTVLGLVDNDIPPTGDGTPDAWSAFENMRQLGEQAIEALSVGPMHEEDIALAREGPAGAEALRAVLEGRKTFEAPEPAKPEPNPWSVPGEDEDDPDHHPEGYEPDVPLPDGFEED